MKPLSLEEICSAVNATITGTADAPPAQTMLTGVTIDSRSVKPGDLFVAIAGERFDGHAFLGPVLQAGAVAAIVRQGAPIDPQVLAEHSGRLLFVNDTIEALGLLGAYHRQQVPVKVLAVTGSNGKTTVKRMIHHILAKTLKGSASPKSYNNNIGVPLTLLGAMPQDDYVVCEVGSNAPGEIESLARIAGPDIAVITSVAETHLEKLGNIHLVAIEKASILSCLAPRGSAIVWADSAPLDEALQPYHARFEGLGAATMIRFGLSPDSDLRLTHFAGSSDRSNFRINDKIEVELPSPGRHNALNAMAAIATAVQMGLTVHQAAQALADFAGVEMRLQSIQAGTVRIINDAYNANPASVVAAADVLNDQLADRRVMIVGDMRELGEASVALHERTGHEIARRRIDLLIGVGALGRYIASGAAADGLAAKMFDSVEEAATAVASLVRPGDVVLVKGSRSMAMERLIPPLQQAFSNDASDKPKGS